MANVVSLLSKKSSNTSQNFFEMVENMPIAVMTCRVSDFKIDYVNKKSYELLDGIKHLLAIDPKDLVGASVDVFHKAPEMQRELLANPNNLPHSANIKVGPEILDLNVSAVYDGKGNYTHAMLSWSVITEAVRKEEETERLMQMIDNMPLNVMTCDIHDDFKINYVNQTSLKTIKSIEGYLPIRADELMGSSIDVFHKAPEMQRQLLSDPSNLPHIASIKVGPETLCLEVSAINDKQGKYLGPMLSWSVVTQNVNMAEKVSDVVGKVSDKAVGMDDASIKMVGMAKQAEELAMSVSSAAEELSATVKEISSQVSSSSLKAQEASTQARETDNMVGSLDEAATSIGGVVEVIEDIAEKTNLLALNATIEAARAGDAGKGFAVVASEVKDLANQTTKSTQEIREKITSMQDIVKTTVSAIGQIATVINELSEAFASIAAAVEEQSATTSTVSKDIGGVQEASVNTGQAAENVKQVAADLNQYATELNEEITNYMKSTS